MMSLVVVVVVMMSMIIMAMVIMAMIIMAMIVVTMKNYHGDYYVHGGDGHNDAH